MRAISILPSAIASELAEYGLKRWDVTRRIQPMNYKLMKELGQKVAEKQGHKGALTSFARDAWRQTKEEISIESQVFMR